MATITTDTYLDGGTARTAGEAWTCNGARLTVRTDTRWHLNAPASMTGALGAVTISATLGGGYTLEGRNVRWMPFNTGSGNVPAIGTTITQGGVSGYLLGVWASLTTAPTAVAAAMPTSGFIKFREVTGGPFSAGALTGIGASATGPDVVGWIEVVHDQAVSITVPRLGDFTVRGDWFELGTTSGSANQLLQVPTNGSTTTYVPGVWIETATAGAYEFVPTLYAAGFSTTYIGTDTRAKFVCMETNGQIRIGHNGTTAVGYVWPAGRKVRIPNIFGRQCVNTTRATNAIPSSTATTRPDFVTTGAGAIDIDKFATDWYMQFAQPYSVKMYYLATFDYINVSECATAMDIRDGGSGTSQSIDARTVTLTSNFANGSLIEDWVCHRYSAGTTDHAFECLYSSGITVRRVKSGIIATRSTGVPFQFTQCRNITKVDCDQFNGPTVFTTCFDSTDTGTDHCDRFVSTTNTTTPVHAVSVDASSNNIIVSGTTFGLRGTIANIHPYNGLFSCGASSNITFRNCGTKAAPLNGGSANMPLYIFRSLGNNQNIRVQRCYVTPTGTGALLTLNSDKGNTYDHVYGDGADAIVTADLNGHIRNCAGTSSVTGQASVYGTHFWDAFVSDTVGRITLPMNEPTAETAAYVTTVAGTPKFTSAGQLVMASLNDEVIFEMDYFCKGVTAFTNTAPVVTGTNATYVSGPDWGNHDIYFQYDIGSGWNGTWLDLTAANLVAVGAINPAIGVKLKYRVVCDTASTTNALTYIRVQTTSTAAAQADNLYPLDTVTLTLTGLVSGSDIVILAAGTSTILSQTDAWAGTTFAYAYETPQAVDIGVLKPGYVPLYFRNYSLGSSNASLPVAQFPDRNYSA